MPPRRGIFGRIVDWFHGAPEPVYEPPPTPEPPLIPLPPQPSEHDREQRRIFDDVTSHNGIEYEEWKEVWGPMSTVYNYIDDDEEREEAELNGWDEFLRAYYLTSDEPGAIPRERFHQDTNIPQSQVDWELWRTIKRGTP